MRGMMQQQENWSSSDGANYTAYEQILREERRGGYDQGFKSGFDSGYAQGYKRAKEEEKEKIARNQKSWYELEGWQYGIVTVILVLLSILATHFEQILKLLGL